MKNKKRIFGGTAAAVTAVATIGAVLLGGGVEVPYEIYTGEYTAYMTIDAPREVSADTVELYANDQLVCKTLLPTGRLETTPMMYNELENLSIKIYARGEQTGVGEFKKDKLIFREVFDNEE